MRFSQFFASVACLCAATFSVQAAPTPAEIISKARGKVGTEAQLTSVKTIILQGDLFDKDGAKVAYVEVKGKLPNMRSEYRLQTAQTLEVMQASNGLEGYRKVKQGQRQQVQPLPLGDILANTDNLLSEISFFAAPEGGSVSYEAEILQQNKPCYVLAYAYKGGLHIRRFFDKTTGQLVAQELYGNEKTPPNERLLAVVEGEITPPSGGLPIRFPKKVTHYLDGKKLGTIEYSKVEVNSAIDDSVFAFPMP